MENHIRVILMKKSISFTTESTNTVLRWMFRVCAAIFGGAYYAFLEVLWRGYTHWTMIFAGACALAFMYFVFIGTRLKSFLAKCLLSAAGVCTIEFLIGCIVNLWLRWDVWDYSEMGFNLLGQICPVFFCVWFVLSIPASFVCRMVQRIEDDIFALWQNTKRRAE